MEFEIGDLFLDGRSRKRIVAEYSYTDEHGATLYQNVRFEPKDFRQRRPNGSGGWTWKLGNVRRVLYRLPEVLAAKEVLLVEGEKDADAARALGFMATSSGAAGTWRKEFSDPLCGKLVTIIADADDPGRKHAQRVARLLLGKAESLKLLELPGAKDLFEWVEHGGSRATLLDLIESTPEWKPQAVNGSTILDEVFGYIRRFVSLSESQARVVALWIFHTHLLSSAFSTPYLAITSAEKQSGKTRLLEVLETLVSNPWLTGKVTAAVLTRKIDAEQATLLLDESDAAFAGDKDYSEALRGVLNTGHRRGGKSSCCVGQGANISFRDFSTFSPKAIAGIGKLPDTVADRAIPIRLKRVAPGEGVERFRRREIDSEAARLRQNIATWSGLNAEKLSDARPTLPDALTDRQQDGAEPLLAIADAAGEEWPQIARRALIQLCSEAQACDESIGKLLLTDISQVFEALGADRLSSAGLASELAGIEISPWSEWSHGKPLTPARLARLLSPYGIVPHSIRIADKTPKGYEREDFKDAFRRYLRVKDTSLTLSLTSQSATPQQANTAAAFVDFSNCNTKLASPAKKCEIANENKPSCGVAVSDPATEAGHRGVEEDL
ncbi:MAG TPA: DUF3631 domain-containing protein [Candidatus Acidoferrales bacterium]|nr:DUF3631 domain-containing protein [Candidatus Acidoferrales bacterium]